MAPTAEQILKLVAEYAAERHATAGLRPGAAVRARLRPGVRRPRRSSSWCGRASTSGSPPGPRRSALRARARATTGPAPRAARQLRLVGQPRRRRARSRRRCSASAGCVPGDEVITVAAGFPTTVNPIVQNGFVPVFVDVSSPTYNIDVAQLEAAVSERTRAVVVAHTLGNPFDLDAVTAFCAPPRPAASSRTAATRSAPRYDGTHGRHLRRLRHALVLPRPPHHDGRGRRRPHQPRRA